MKKISTLLKRSTGRNIFTKTNVMGKKTYSYSTHWKGNGDNAALLDWIARGGTGSQTVMDAYVAFDVAVSSFRNRIYRWNTWADSVFNSAITIPFYIGNGTVQMGDLNDTNLNFVAGDWGILTGLGGDGATKAIQTGFSPSTESIAANALGLGVWNLTTGAGGGIEIGAYAAGQWSLIVCNIAGNTWYPIGQAGNVFDPVGIDRGFIFGVRNNDNNNRLYVDGVNTLTQVAGGMSVSTEEVNIYRSDNIPGIGGYSARTMYGYIITGALSSAEVLALYNAWNAFNIAIGR